MTDTETEREPIEVVPGQLALDLGTPETPEIDPASEPIVPWADWSKGRTPEAVAAIKADAEAAGVEPEDIVEAGERFAAADAEHEVPADAPTIVTKLGFAVPIAPDLKPLLKPLADYNPHPRNFRKHKLDAIAESMREHGVQSPLVVQKSTGYVCKGNGSYKTAVALGLTEFPISVVDFDDEQAWKYLLADNRASDLASYEGDLLVQELERLVDSGDFQGTLWTPDEAEDAIAEAGAVRVTAPFEFKGGYAETPESIAARAEKGAQSGTKLKEVPVSMTTEEHTVFMAELKALAKHFGTSGTIATIIEAVHRAYAGLPAAEPKPTKPPKEKKAKVDLVAEATKVFEGDLAEPSEEEMVAAVTN